MLAKKYYKEIASTLRENFFKHTNIPIDENECLVNIVESLSIIFKKDNSNFDENEFKAGIFFDI